MRGDEQELAKLLICEDPLALVKGVIDTVGSGGAAGTVSLFLKGETTPVFGIRYFAHYTPTVGDVVWCFKIGPSLIVFGKLANRP